jgi:hypothetical protein
VSCRDQGQQHCSYADCCQLWWTGPRPQCQLHELPRVRTWLAQLAQLPLLHRKLQITDSAVFLVLPCTKGCTIWPCLILAWGPRAPRAHDLVAWLSFTAGYLHAFCVHIFQTSDEVGPRITLKLKTKGIIIIIIIITITRFQSED